MERLAASGEPVEGTPFGRYRLIELLGRQPNIRGDDHEWRVIARASRTASVYCYPALAVRYPQSIVEITGFTAPTWGS